MRPLVSAGIVPLVLGGDHSIVLGELRAQAAVHGPVALVLLDAHADTWDQYYGERYFHGTPFRRALEEGLLDPARSTLAGMRGPLYEAADLQVPREMGFELITGDELVSMSARDYGERVRARLGDRPGVPVVRHRRARSGFGAGYRNSGGRGPAASRGAGLPARAGGDLVHGL